MADLQTWDMLIDGQWCQASDGGVFESINPADGTPWALIPEATAKDVDRAVRAAAKAGEHDSPWSRMTPTERGGCLKRLGRLLADASEELGEIETRDTGKMFKETRWQAQYIASFFEFYGGAADKIAGDTLPIDKADMFVFTRREPLGVIAAIVPWNSQLFLSAVKIGPALAAGNTVVLKASEDGPVAMLAFGRLMAEAGIPDGVVNIITGHGEPCGQALTAHPLVARVAFTGGGRSAARVIRNTAENFAEISLELGGKSPLIVFDDADMESAVNGAVAGIFAASGQSCVAGSRLCLHEDIADAFIEKITAIAARIKLGDPMAEATEMGPLCTPGQIAHIEEQIALAREQGGKVLVGGAKADDHGAENGGADNGGADNGGGLFFQPTIIDCPHKDMTILGVELFGPVLAVLRFRTEDEALMLANDTEYGLAAGIFTRDGKRAMRLAQRIRAGIIWLNTYRVISPIAEFGGMKASGHGREGGLQAVLDYTRPKTVWMNLSDDPIANPFEPR